LHFRTIFPFSKIFGKKNFSVLHKAPFGERLLKYLPQLPGRVEVDEWYSGTQRSGKRGQGAEGITIVAVAVGPPLKSK